MQVPCSGCKKECFSELVGTYALVFLGPGSVIVASIIPNFEGFLRTVFIASVFGGTVGIVILFLGNFGAFINPAITFGASFSKVLSSKFFIPFLFFQILGGLLAGFSLKIVFGTTGGSTELGSTLLAPGVSPVLGITLEAAGTFILTSSALIASTQLRRNWQKGLLVGLTLFSLILLIGPLTGAGFNPARSLGPALAAGFFQNLPIYIVGPVLGASVAGLVFRGLRENGRNSSNLVCLC
jgi:glycerol uptake facilitator-like aquaporin